jgi:hypothetical protein
MLYFLDNFLIFFMAKSLFLGKTISKTHLHSFESEWRRVSNWRYYTKKEVTSFFTNIFFSFHHFFILIHNSLLKNLFLVICICLYSYFLMGFTIKIV